MQGRRGIHKLMVAKLTVGQMPQNFYFRCIKPLVVQFKKNDCDICGCDCLKSKKFVSMRTCELDDIPVDSSYCIGDETKFLDIDCTAQCSSSGIR